MKSIVLVKVKHGKQNLENGLSYVFQAVGSSILQWYRANMTKGSRAHRLELKEHAVSFVLCYKPTDDGHHPKVLPL